MTPKEQAGILVATMCKPCGIFSEVTIPFKVAVKAAIVATELMIDNTPPGLNGQWLFWVNVKNELKEL
jgi:hypothetical protein